MKLAVLSSLLASAAAFAPASQSGKPSMALNAEPVEKMPSMPFLPYPENLRGYIGDDLAFDPLRISDYFPADYLREAELKHGRICMLATVGYVTVDLGIIVHPYGQGLTSATAHDAMVANGVMGNALVFIGIAEMVGYLAVAEMLQGSGRQPGDFGVGYRYLPDDPEKVKDMKMKELANGRLAMLAFGGMVTQSVLNDTPFPYF